MPSHLLTYIEWVFNLMKRYRAILLAIFWALIKDSIYCLTATEPESSGMPAKIIMTNYDL